MRKKVLCSYLYLSLFFLIYYLYRCDCSDISVAYFSWVTFRCKYSYYIFTLTAEIMLTHQHNDASYKYFLFHNTRKKKKKSIYGWLQMV